MQNPSDGILHSWSHFGGNRPPVLVQKVIHCLTELCVAIEQIVQLYIGIPDIKVHKQIANAQMLVAPNMNHVRLNRNASINVRCLEQIKIWNICY